MVYVGFWRRLCARFIDAIVLLPLDGICIYFSERYRLVNDYQFLIWNIIEFLFTVYLVFKYGGTPGKLILKTKITMLDGTPVTLKASILRNSVFFISAVITSSALMSSSVKMPMEIYSLWDYSENFTKVFRSAPPWYSYVKYMNTIWICIEIATMLLNEKRRTVHDFIAGTVVIRRIKSI